MKPDLKALLQELRKRGHTLPEGPIAIGEYGDSPELSSELIALIKSGKKCATSSLVWSYEAEGEPLPKVGDHELVIDAKGSPVLLTRTVSTQIQAFSAISEEQARLEGEGDLSLAYWRQGHWAFFSRECEQIGREPNMDMPIVYTQFELIDIYG